MVLDRTPAQPTPALTVLEEDRHAWFAGRTRAILKYLDAEVGPHQPGGAPRRVLDVGAGAGNMAHHLAHYGQVIGMDFNPRPLVVAGMRALDVCQAAGDRLPFPANTFDLVALLDTVEHIPDEFGVFDEVPRVLKPGESRIANFLVSLDCPILVRSTGILHELSGVDRVLIGDFSLNAANTLTAEAYLALGLARLTPTHDLNAAQIAALARYLGPEHIEAIAYQHLPVFHTEHCVFCRFLSEGTTHKDCGRPCEEHRVALRDRQGRAHPVMADVGCRTTVFGAEAQEASAHLREWEGAGIRHFRLEFVHESAREVIAVTEAFQQALAGNLSPDALAHTLRRIAPEGTTEGSLFVPKDYLTFPILQ